MIAIPNSTSSLGDMIALSFAAHARAFGRSSAGGTNQPSVLQVLKGFRIRTFPP